MRDYSARLLIQELTILRFNRYNTRLDFTVNAIDLALVILTAIDKDKFDSISFYDLMNQTGACVADMFVDGGFKISSVFADISSMTDPVLTGIGDVDLQNLMNTAVEILFDMYVVSRWIIPLEHRTQKRKTGTDRGFSRDYRQSLIITSRTLCTSMSIILLVFHAKDIKYLLL